MNNRKIKLPLWCETIWIIGLDMSPYGCLPNHIESVLTFSCQLIYSSHKMKSMSCYCEGRGRKVLPISVLKLKKERARVYTFDDSWQSISSLNLECSLAIGYEISFHGSLDSSESVFSRLSRETRWLERLQNGSMPFRLGKVDYKTMSRCTYMYVALHGVSCRPLQVQCNHDVVAKLLCFKSYTACSLCSLWKHFEILIYFNEISLMYWIMTIFFLLSHSLTLSNRTLVWMKQASSRSVQAVQSLS